MNEKLPVLRETITKLKKSNESLSDELLELVEKLEKKIENNELKEIIDAETKIQEFLTDHKADIEQESSIETIQTELSSLKTSIATKEQENTDNNGLLRSTRNDENGEKKWWRDSMSDGWKKFWKWTWIAALATATYVAVVKLWGKSTEEGWDDEESAEEKDIDQKEIASWYEDPLRGRGNTIPNNGFFWAKRDGWNRLHKWLDIAAVSWTPIFPAMPGIVESITYSKGWWNTITLKHPNGDKTKYLHLKEKPQLRVWTQVNNETIIGLVGNTWIRKSWEWYWNHLHFEVVRNGKAINPWECCDFDYVEEGNSKGKVA
jgi:murein DD-endopeptidase MepM/ murein hydrolase activator NlpD